MRITPSNTVSVARAETLILRLLDAAHANSLAKRHRSTQARIEFHRRVRDCAEAGRVALVRSGVDCDYVRYSGDVCYVEADWRKVDERIAHDLEWADGPMRHVIERPSVAARIGYESRDLALEAFEDGHPHYIRY